MATNNIRKANQRIKAIREKTGKDSWAVEMTTKKLEKIGMLSDKGYIRKPKTELQERKVNKIVSSFLNMETSSLRGIANVRKRTIETFRDTFAIDDTLTRKEATILYNFLGDRNYEDLVDKIGASMILALNVTARAENMSKEDYIDLFTTQIAMTNDIETKKTLEDIYNKYIKKHKTKLIETIENLDNEPNRKRRKNRIIEILENIE